MRISDWSSDVCSSDLQDSEGNKGVIYPGLAQRMSAGTGILHSEKNDAWRVQGGASHDDPVRFIQMWVPPDENGIEPGYEQREIDDADLSGKLVRSEEHTSELQSLMRISYAVFCLKKKKNNI